MDALEELRQMHVEAKDTFAKIQSAGATDRAGLWAKLRPELELHEQIEEKFVYDPGAEEAGATDEGRARGETEPEEQVQEAAAVMAQIGELEPASAGWLAQVTM